MSAGAQLAAAMATMDIINSGKKIEPRTEYSTIAGVSGPLVILENVRSPAQSPAPPPSLSFALPACPGGRGTDVPRMLVY